MIANSDSLAGARAPHAASSRRAAVLRVIQRTPLTACLVLTLLVVGITTNTLIFTATEDQPWFPTVGTGLPAFAEGRWYTIATAIFFVTHPAVFLVTIPFVIGGLGWAEWQFGTLRAAAIFVGGHVVGVLGSAAVIWVTALTGWEWALEVAQAYDVGPSCGALAALVFAIATLPSPWRLRARLAVVTWVAISMLYLGRVDDVAHSAALVGALAVSGLLTAFRRPIGRPTQREWRLLALFGLISIGAIQVIDLVVPYDGPLGSNTPTASAIDVAIDVIMIALLANGIRSGYRVAWVITLALGAFNLLTAGLVAALLPLLVSEGIIASASEAWGFVLAPAILWLALMALLITAHGAFRVRFRASRRTLGAAAITRDQLADTIRRLGGGTISWMGTWRGNERVAVTAQRTSADPSQASAPGAAASAGAIAYQSWAGVAIMLGDPIVASGEEARALAEFERVAEQAGLIPCAFSVSAATAAARPPGWRAVIVAEDTIVDLPGLKFAGKPWGAVRTALNRAGREGMTFRMARLAEEPWRVLAQVRAISEQWSGDKSLPEMRFTLGTVEEALDPEAYVGLAFDGDGNLHGVTSWLPVYAPSAGEPRIAGWTLDLMRRRDGAFPPVMEFLIASSAQWFSDQGYEFVSLSGAPLVRPEGAETGPVDQVLEQIGGLIEPLYGFKSLHRFKQKFNPRHESLYLLFRDEGDLPRIGIAITRAYLPDASLRDLVTSATGAGAPGSQTSSSEASA